MFINFYGCELENVFNPIACDCKIQNMIKNFKEKAINHKINEIEKLYKIYIVKNKIEDLEKDFQ